MPVITFSFEVLIAKLNLDFSGFLTTGLRAELHSNSPGRLVQATYCARWSPPGDKTYWWFFDSRSHSGREHICPELPLALWRRRRPLLRRSWLPSTTAFKITRCQTMLLFTKGRGNPCILWLRRHRKFDDPAHLGGHPPATALANRDWPGTRGRKPLRRHAPSVLLLPQ